MAACYDGSLGTAIMAWLVLTVWFGIRFPLASARGMLTVKQMQSPHPKHRNGEAINEGIALMEHGSTKTCLVALNAILATFVGWFLQQWLDRAPVEFALQSFGIDLLLPTLFVSHVAGYAFSGVCHFVWAGGKYPEADFEPKRDGERARLSPCGWVHFTYFGEATSLVIQIYLFTDGVPPPMLFLMTAYMTGHIWLGNHFWNRITKPEGFPAEYSFYAP